MTNIDSAIRNALSKEDAEFLARFEDKNPIGEALGTFSGQWGVLNIFAAIITFGLFGAFVYCAGQMFVAVAVRDVVLWSSGAIVFTLAVAMLKIYFFMEMNKNVVLREVKRLELQVARLTARDSV
jgi:hypothetical protein